jgi:CRP-like cAMP-binding protein
MFTSHRTPQVVLDELRRISLFNGCSDAELRQIDRLATPEEVDAGVVLCREGRVGRQAFVIVAGEATVTIGGVEAARLGPGSFFGEMSVLDRAPRVGTVTSATPMSLLVFSATELSSLVDVPRIGRRMLTTVNARLRLADRSFAESRR